MLADFTITIHGAKELAVQVKVHNNINTLRTACARYDNKWTKGSECYSDTLGICHRFYTDSNPVCAIVRLAPPNLGVGVISHEMAHAAVWIREIEQNFNTFPLTCENDERFCWILGELIRQTVSKLIEIDDRDRNLFQVIQEETNGQS